MCGAHAAVSQPRASSADHAGGPSRCTLGSGLRRLRRTGAPRRDGRVRPRDSGATLAMGSWQRCHDDAQESVGFESPPGDAERAARAPRSRRGRLSVDHRSGLRRKRPQPSARRGRPERRSPRCSRCSARQRRPALVAGGSLRVRDCGRPPRRGRGPRRRRPRGGAGTRARPHRRMGPHRAVSRRARPVDARGGRARA